MKKKLLIVSLFYISMNNAVATQPIQPTASFFNATSTLSELKERSKRPDFIRHGDTGFSWGRVFNFYDKHIFFDKDISGRPVYKRISEHAADNTNFGKIILIIYYPQKKYPNQFVIVGTYSNQVARKKLLRKMQTFFGYTKEGAIWCPEQNAIIAGTNDPEIGKIFEKWFNNNKESVYVH